MTTPIPVTRADVKRLSVIKQGLHQRDTDLRRVVNRIGLLQLDSISVVARSHYLVMLARAGIYDPADLDALLDDGALFETWAHAACLVPIADYPYFHARLMQKRLGEVKWHIERLGDQTDIIIEQVRETIRQRGPLSSRDFDIGRKQPGGWWNWKPAKIALEYLFSRGELLVSHRRNFQRYYDLPERVLAKHNFTLDKSLDDFQRFTFERGLRHIGVAASNHIAEYYHQPKRAAAGMAAAMLETGEALPVAVKGWDAHAYLHRDDLALLRQVQRGEIPTERTVFLSPFDNLFWDRDRDFMLWDFYYRIEVYTPKAKRVHGYYVMPILHGCELVGRMDPKVDRKAKRLICHNLHLERGVKLTGALMRGIISAFEEFMVFHGCEDFELGRCNRIPLERRIRKHFG